MARLLTGFICLSDIPKQLMRTHEGKVYIDIDQWINDKPSEKGYIAPINVRQTKEQRLAKEAKIGIGNMKDVFPQNAESATTVPPATTGGKESLPF